MFQDNPQQPEQSQQPETQPQEPQTPQPEQSQQTQPQPQQPQPPAQPAKPPVKTSQDERMWSAIGYVAFLGVVTLAMKPKSAFCKHHASQGLVLFVVWFIGLILLVFPSFIGAIGGLILLAASVLAILGIVKSIQSYEFQLPVLSNIAKKIPTDSIIGSVTGKKPVETEQPKQEEGQTPPTETTPSPEQPAQEQKQQEQEPPTEKPEGEDKPE